MEKDKIKDMVQKKVNELVECASTAGRLVYFEINIKHVNGEIISNLKFSDKDKIK